MDAETGCDAHCDDCTETAGNVIEDHDLDEVWSEADIYGPTMTRQILEAKHMRSLEAHITTVQALHDSYVE